MINVRYGLFETNSSSVHTLTLVMDKSMYNEWKQNPEERFLKVSNYQDDIHVPEDISLVSKDYIYKNGPDLYANEDDELYYVVTDLNCLIYDEECLKSLKSFDDYIIVEYASY